MAYSRRDFIRNGCCAAAALGVATSFRSFGLINALAQSSSPFQSLVCIFLFGGNDANNMLIPNDSAGYANYNTIRGGGGLALAQSYAAADYGEDGAEWLDAIWPASQLAGSPESLLGRGSWRFSPMSGRSCSRLREHSTRRQLFLSLSICFHMQINRHNGKRPNWMDSQRRAGRAEWPITSSRC